jgi:hypothetical protein
MAERSEKKDPTLVFPYSRADGRERLPCSFLSLGHVFKPGWIPTPISFPPTPTPTPRGACQVCDWHPCQLAPTDGLLVHTVFVEKMEALAWPNICDLRWTQ